VWEGHGESHRQPFRYSKALPGRHLLPMGSAEATPIRSARKRIRNQLAQSSCGISRSGRASGHLPQYGLNLNVAYFCILRLEDKKCPADRTHECYELRSYNEMFRDGDVPWAVCGAWIRTYDAG
jgi:hypothetical protein